MVLFFGLVFFRWPPTLGNFSTDALVREVESLSLSPTKSYTALQTVHYPYNERFGF